MNKCFEYYKDIHIGKRCFIVANGTSLKETNLDLIKDEITIGMNKISLVYDKTEWVPTYYFFTSTNVNNKVWGDSWTRSVRESIDNEFTTSFISSKFKNRIDPKNKYKINWFDSMSETKPTIAGDLDESCFPTQITERIDKSGTSVNVALQMAYWFGFSEICFVGADLGFVEDHGSRNDPNHFDPSYRADMPRPYKANNQMRNVHSLALKYFNKKGVKVYNASVKTVLDTYPIIDLASYLNGELIYRDDDLKTAKEFWDKPPQYKE